MANLLGLQYVLLIILVTSFIIYSIYAGGRPKNTLAQNRKKSTYSLLFEKCPHRLTLSPCPCGHYLSNFKISKKFQNFLHQKVQTTVSKKPLHPDCGLFYGQPLILKFVVDYDVDYYVLWFQ